MVLAKVSGEIEVEFVQVSSCSLRVTREQMRKETKKVNERR
jgi:hypothetical protein